MATAVKKLDYYIVTDGDYDTAENFQSLSYAILGVIIAWSEDDFFNDNFRDLMNGELVTRAGVEYQLFSHEDFIAETTDGE